MYSNRYSSFDCTAAELCTLEVEGIAYARSAEIGDVINLLATIKPTRVSKFNTAATTDYSATNPNRSFTQSLGPVVQNTGYNICTKCLL